MTVIRVSIMTGLALNSPNLVSLDDVREQDTDDLDHELTSSSHSRSSAANVV